MKGQLLCVLVEDHFSIEKTHPARPRYSMWLTELRKLQLRRDNDRSEGSVVNSHRLDAALRSLMLLSGTIQLSTGSY